MQAGDAEYAIAVVNQEERAAVSGVLPLRVFRLEHDEPDGCADVLADEDAA
jgi:hypothetical protein